MRHYPLRRGECCTIFKLTHYPRVLPPRSYPSYSCAILPVIASCPHAKRSNAGAAAATASRCRMGRLGPKGDFRKLEAERCPIHVLRSYPTEESHAEGCTARQRRGDNCGPDRDR